MFDRCSIIQAYDRSHYSCLLRSRLLFTVVDIVLYIGTLHSHVSLSLFWCLDGCWYHFRFALLYDEIKFEKVIWYYLLYEYVWLTNYQYQSSYDWNSFISMCEDCRTFVNQLEVYLLKKQCINTKTSSVAQYEWIVKIVPALKFISSNFLYKRLCLEKFNTW